MVTPPNIKHDEIGTLNQPGTPPEAILKWFCQTFWEKTFACSFGLEDMVLLQMLQAEASRPRVFVLDTGRLHQETYQLMDEAKHRFNIQLDVYSPDTKELEVLTSTYGFNHFYHSVEGRKQCCHIRKVRPLRRALQNQQAWLTGLRTQQSSTRKDIKPIEFDEPTNMWKVSPLAFMPISYIKEYAVRYNVPQNPLHDQGYPTIGCEPCTRSVQPHEDIRAGRWWWEQKDHRECGLHDREQRRFKHVANAQESPERT